jgi:hypothetical protein
MSVMSLSGERGGHATALGGRLEASRLAGTGLIADDLYLLAHDDRTGRPALKGRPLGIGLAGGLLAELLLDGSSSLQRDGTITAHRRRPADDLERRVLDQIAAEGKPCPLRTLLLFFARSVAGDVASRLEQAGYLRHAGSRIPGRAGRWVPVDATWALTAVVRARSALDPARPADPRHVVLAGLAGACGLRFRLAQFKVPGNRTIEEATARLDPDLRYLIAQTQVSCDSAMLSHRA